MRHLIRLEDIFKFRECFDDAVEFYTKAITLCPDKESLDETVNEMQMDLKRRNIQPRKQYISESNKPFTGRYQKSSALTCDNIYEELANPFFRKGQCLIKLT